MNNFDDLIPLAKRAGFIATALSAVITARFGWDQGEDWAAGLVLAGLLALATFIVGYSLVFAHRAAAEKKWGIAIAACVLFVCSSAMELASHVGFNNANRLQTVQGAKLDAVRWDDGRKSVTELEQKLALKREQATWNGKSLPNIIAAIDTAKLNPRWTSSAECTDVTTQKSRTFCGSFSTLLAEKANAEEAATVEQEIPAIEADLKTARNAAAAQSPELAAADSQSLMFSALYERTEKPSESGKFWSLVGVGLLMAVFALVAGALLNLLAFAWDATRPSGPAAAPVASEHPDVIASLRAQAAALAAKSREMMDPPDLAKRRFLGAIAAPGGGITPMSRIEAGINWKSAA